MECLHGEFGVEPGNGGDRCDYLREKGIDTYLVLVPRAPQGKNGINSVVSHVCTRVDILMFSQIDVQGM